ncbi:hypothetical protein MAR_008470 [Mya arenaria]|uniref:Uncharacterized protein n=1 Tax=Mya arenaria TaxID=6604 RepID=A0ABY7DW39_MYAAR|nr:hypothetical protein MAR_008470 [Mya arenaria]
MDCSTPIEFPYYAGNNPVAVRKDICCHCGEGGTEIDAALLQKYKTVLPVCRACKLIKDIPKRNPINKYGIDIPGDSLEGVVSVRLQMDCSTPIEFPYYAGNNPVAVRKDICCHCGEGGTEIDAALLQKYKTVLPVCRACKLIKDIPKRNPIK